MGVSLRHFEAPDPLSVERVVQFARGEFDATVGADYEGQVFLAGGAFKSLLHGRSSTDIDFWAPSEAERARLVERLLARGARRVPGGQFGEACTIGGRLVDLPFRTEPPDLEARLGRFDIGLSAVGVELRNGTCRAVVDPLARLSEQTRRVLLLKPLVNWKYALATLSRMRRYAAELGYESPPEEEAAVWEVFDAQDAPMQDGMVQRFLRCCAPDPQVVEEAAWHRR